jgi:hypothetical protein
LGKGKPFCASKIAKKKLGFGNVSGRPKGVGNGGTCLGKVIGGYQKRQRVTDFGRKRAPKAKMRGIFGVPGLGLQVRIFFHLESWLHCSVLRNSVSFFGSNDKGVLKYRMKKILVHLMITVQKKCKNILNSLNRIP